MTIMVRVNSNRAMAQLAAVRGGIAGVNSGVAAGNRMSPLGAAHMGSLIKFGSRLQWVGRQLQYNFTLPILLAGGAAVKFAMDQEKAMVHVAKVYGDVNSAQKFFQKQSHGALTATEAHTKAIQVQNQELGALDNAFTAISEHYGVQKKDVLEVAGAWAAAGASGERLARSVNDTMTAMIIGDMSAADATQALISIQAQYNLNSQELMATLATLNSVENQTGASMSDLITGFSRAAGSARSAGVDVNHLAAYMAALVPATGTAANAGNALKTVFSRLLSPTEEAEQVMHAMGLEISSKAWQSSTAVERIDLMAKKFNALGAAQQNVAASVIASRWQINKFQVLMKEVSSDTGYYAKALDAAGNAGENFKTLQKELNTVLESDPRRLQRMWVMIQNASVNIIQPLIPFIIYIAKKLGDWAQAFGNLEPHMQKLILFTLVTLAAIGPLVRYMGALQILVGVLGTAVIRLAGAFVFLGRIMLRITLIPLLKFFSLVADGIVALGALMWRGLARIFLVGNLTVLRMWITQWTIMVGVAQARIITILNFVKLGWLRLKLYMLAGSLANVSIWVTMWEFIKTLSIFGWLTQFKIFRKGMGLVAVMKAMGTFMIGAWSAMWGTITAITGAGWALIRTEWIVAGIGVTGIWKTVQIGLARITVLGAAAIEYITVAWQVTMGAIFGKLRVYLTGLWIATWARLRAIALLAAIGEMGIWTALWTGMKVVAANAAVGIVTIVGGLWRGLVAITTIMGLGMVKVAGYMWRGMLALSAAGAVSMKLLFTRLRAVLVIIWTTTAALASTIWKGMALTMVMFSRAAVVGVIGVFKGLAVFLLNFGKYFLRFGKFIVGWPALIIGAVLLVVALFHDQIRQVLDNIVKMLQSAGNPIAGFFNSIGNAALDVFRMLPEGVQKSMIAVVTIVRNAALAVYGWFQYLNPFASHSPSLVDNVTKGMGVIVKQFSNLGKIKQYTDAAYKEVSRFGKLTAGLSLNADVQQHKEDRKSIKQAGGGPAALGSYNKLVGLLNKLNPLLNKIQAQLTAQQRVVDAWQAKVDRANDKLDVQQKKLDGLNDVLNKYQDQLSAAQDRLSNFASTPLKGMQAMNDQIQANTVEQNKLKLAMMNMEDATGPLDDIKSKLDAINGAQEVLRGKRADLAAGGAGSDVLKTYDDEIAKLEKQKKGYVTSSNALQDMQTALDKLQRQADRLDLVKAVKFDDLQYQIDKAANSMKEMPFNEIMAGMKGARDDIDKYSGKVDVATKAVNRQQKVVDTLTAARDRLQNRLDAESKVLDRIQARYDKVNNAIQAINDAISNVVSSADKMNQALAKKKKVGKGGKESVSPGLKNFRMAGNADFPDPGGSGLAPRKNWKSQVKGIDAFTKSLSDQTSNMFDQLNPFKPLIDKAKQAWKKIEDWIGKHAPGVGHAFSKAFSGVKGPKMDGSFMKGVRAAFKGFMKIVHDITKAVGHAWDLIGPDIKKIGGALWHGFGQIWKKIEPELAQFKDLIKPLGKAFMNLWAVIKPVLGFLLVEFGFVIKVITSIVAEVLGPLLSRIGKIIADVIRVVRGALEIILGLLTGDMTLFKKGIKDVVEGIFNGIVNIIGGAFQLIWNIAQGFVKGVVHFFEWLYNVLVGHSIIPDMVDKIIATFHLLENIVKWVWDHVLKPIWQKFKAIWNGFIKPVVRGLVHFVFAEIRGWVIIAKWVWDHVLKPIWQKFKDIWNNYLHPIVKTIVRIVKDEIKGWITIAKWVWDHVLKPIWDKFKTAFDKVKEIIRNAKEFINEKLDRSKTRLLTSSATSGTCPERSRTWLISSRKLERQSSMRSGTA
jgi:TP901 family phage tail tape measure protein